MPKPVPKWVSLAYSEMLKKFGDNPFTPKEVKNIVGDSAGVIIHTLKKSGWIEFLGLDEKDDRKRFYKLKSPNDIFANLEKNGKPKNTKRKK